MATIVLFLDGVGLAPMSAYNPLAHVPMPHLYALLGGPLTLEHVTQRSELRLQPLDATLGVPGLPQSGTGHVALLAGVNAPALHGRHQPNFPPVALRPLLAERSLFRRAMLAGFQVAFANVFTPGYFAALANRRIRASASVLAAQAAGLPLRDLDALRAGQALSWDITGHALQARGEALDLMPVRPELAGQRLAALAHDHALVFFECFLTDLAGHGRLGPDGPAEALRRVDGLLGGLLATRCPGDTLVVTSDHGNLEDSSVKMHSEAPVPLLVIGPAAPAFAMVTRLDQVADAVLASLRNVAMLNKSPVKVLFVCMGNICRSPMAEAVFRHQVAAAGLTDQFVIDSAGTGGWHAGEPPHHGTQAILQQRGVAVGDQRARQVRPADLHEFDYVVAMDDENLRDLRRSGRGDLAKVRLLLDYAPELGVREVPDPYYSGGFAYVYDLIEAGCAGLLAQIRSERGL